MSGYRPLGQLRPWQGKILLRLWDGHALKKKRWRVRDIPGAPPYGPVKLPLAVLAEVVGEEVDALPWLARLMPETRAQAEEYFTHWAENRIYLETLREEFEGGDPEALFRAIDTAGGLHMPIPEWAAQAFSEGWERYEDFGYITPKGATGRLAALGGAFGIQRASAHQPAEQRRRRYWFVACQMVKNYDLEPGKRNKETHMYKRVAVEIADPTKITDPLIRAVFRLEALPPCRIGWQTIRDWYLDAKQAGFGKGQVRRPRRASGWPSPF